MDQRSKGPACPVGGPRCRLAGAMNGRTRNRTVEGRMDAGRNGQGNGSMDNRICSLEWNKIKYGMECRMEGMDLARNF